VKIASICALLILLSSAYDWYPAIVNAAAEPMRESRDLSAYVHLHRTRNDPDSSRCH
jgi:hypothetical protein